MLFLLHLERCPMPQILMDWAWSNLFEVKSENAKRQEEMVQSGIWSDVVRLQVAGLQMHACKNGNNC